MRKPLRHSSSLAKLGSISYVVWGLLHFQAAYAVYSLGASLASSMVQARVYQDAWNLLLFSIAAIGVAVAFNWRNSRWGYWVNFGVVGVADTGFIFFVLAPGHLGLWPGLLGPVFWALGVLFTTLALRSDKTTT
jgi:hypothetical protein